MKRINKNAIVTVLAVSFVLGLIMPIAALAATTPSLGAAAAYGVLASTYTDTSAATTVNGSVGFTTGPATAIGGVHTNFGSGAPYATAGTDQGTALSALASQLCTFTFPAGAVNLSTDITHGPVGVYTPGVYCSSGAMNVGGPLTLSGAGTYIFRAVGALTSTAGSIVTLAGASACDVFWTPTAATTLAATTTFAGTVIDNAGITVGGATTWTGRALAFAGTVTTATDTITVPVCAVPTGSITVAKNAVGGNGTFAFTSNFGLVSPLTTVGGTVSQTVSGLAPGGAYSLSETVPAGWTQTSATCTNGTPAAITVVAGLTTTCTITNTVVAPPPTGSITVVKNTVGGNGTFAFTSNFGLTSLTTVGGTASLTFGGLTAGGAFSLSETVPAGWTQTGASCTNGTPAAITVVAGLTTTCTITNTFVAPTGSITVVKNAVGGNGTFAFTSNFGLISPLTTVGGTVSQTVSGLAPGGAYSLSETVPLPAGWAQTGASCTNGTPAAITVVAGATTTCTITNTFVAPTGSITVVKNAVGGDGTFAFTSNFGLTFLTTLGGTASLTFGGLAAGGSFSLSETVPAGWTQTSASCTNGTPAAITVVAGATTTCTITNTKQGSIKVVKNTVGGDGTFVFTSNFGLTSLTTVGSTASLTFPGLTPGGGFSLSETVPAGWAQTSAICTTPGSANSTPAAITVVAGVTTTCVITNATVTAPPPVGLITIVKNTVGGDGTFTFASNFGLTTLTTSGGTASQTFSNVVPGSGWSVREILPTGWTQVSGSCTNGTLPDGIIVVAGVTTTCTITNSQQGSISVVKNTVGGDGTFAFTSNFGLTTLTTVAGTASQTFTGLAPGTSFSLSETVPSGWAQTSATCTNGTPAAITVVAGVTTTCIITNTKGIPPPVGLITVVKNTVGGDGTFAFSSNFGLTSLTTVGGTASQTFSNLTTSTTYSVNEIVPAGWTQTSASCTNGTPAAITVVAGVTTTCTITNTQLAAAVSDITIRKSHAGNFRQGDTGDTYTLTVTNVGQGPTTGAVTVIDTLPAGLTATDIGGPGWNCTLTTLTCTRSDALAAGASYPVITVTVNVANNGLVFNSVAGSTAFQANDILISLADGTVQWRRHDWTLVKILNSGTDGQAKGMAFDSSGNLYVTHWTGSGSSGNDVTKFDRNGNFIGLFGSGFDCNPASIVFDNSGNAYVSHVDCSTQIFKFDSLGNRLAQYTVAVENRGSYNIALDPNQCTMYYTSAGPNVKRFNVCTNTQMPDFNTAPLPDPVGGAQEFSLLPGGGMLVANFGVIARLDASGNLVTTYNTPAGNHCWLGTALDPDGTSFWASDWCGSSVTRFDIATGNVIESHVADPLGFHVKQIAIPGNIFINSVINIATVAGGGELNISNDLSSDTTTINPPALFAPPVNISAGIVNAASYAPPVAAGSIASVFGSNLSIGTASSAGSNPLPTTLASSSYQVGGRGAPLYYASPGQVNLQIPWELAGQTQATVTATVGGVASNQQTVRIVPFAPGLFTLNEAGSSQGAVLIASTALIAAPPSAAGRRPARGGEIISIYCTGLGAVTNQPATGAASALAGPLSVTTTTPTVTIGGIVAQLQFSGLAPASVGLYQVNVQVPLGATAGDAVPVVLSIGGVASNTVTIAVQ